MGTQHLKIDTFAHLLCEFRPLLIDCPIPRVLPATTSAATATSTASATPPAVPIAPSSIVSPHHTCECCGKLL